MLGALCQPAIIFRGTGTRIRKDEKLQWHPEVDVYWQKCAWVNGKIAVDWVNGTFKDSIANLPGEHLLFLDNLGAHKEAPFEEALDALQVKRYMFPPNNTEHLQPVDAHVGRVSKKNLAGFFFLTFYFLVHQK